MLSRLVGIGLLVALTGGAVHAAAAPRRASLRRATVSPAYVPGELVVRFKPEATAADRKAVLQAEDARAQTSLLLQGRAGGTWARSGSQRTRSFAARFPG
jgi:hypothetical protein